MNTSAFERPLTNLFTYLTFAICWLSFSVFDGSDTVAVPVIVGFPLSVVSVSLIALEIPTFQLVSKPRPRQS